MVSVIILSEKLFRGLRAAPVNNAQYFALYGQSGTDAIVQECASLHILELPVFLPKNWLLLETTDILSVAAMFCRMAKLVFSDRHGRLSENTFQYHRMYRHRLCPVYQAGLFLLLN